MSQSLHIGRNQLCHIGKLFMGIDNAAGGAVCKDEQCEHSDNHNGSEECVNIHHAAESAHDDINGDNSGEDYKCGRV